MDAKYFKEVLVDNFIIRSEEDAYNWLKKATQENSEMSNVTFEGWPILNIRIVGDKFQQSLTPSVMKGLVEFQSAINRSFSLSKYGTTNTNKLTQEEKNQLEFTVKVGEGSTTIDIDLTQIIIEGLKNMDSSTTATVIVSLALIWAGSLAFKNYLANRKNKREREAKTEEDRELLRTMQFISEEETKKFEILASVVKNNIDLENSSKFAYDAKTDLIKSLTRADYAEIGDIEIDSETAKELVKNARRKSEEIRLDGKYIIKRNDVSNILECIVNIENIDTNQAFPALLVNSDLNQEKIKLLQAAEWGRTPIFLAINAKSLNNEIRNAVIIDVKEIIQE